MFEGSQQELKPELELEDSLKRMTSIATTVRVGDVAENQSRSHTTRRVKRSDVGVLEMISGSRDRLVAVLE